MITIRTSTPADIPALRALWQLAFGDSDAYVDNFFNTYYRPKRMLLLEGEGRLLAMTAWFDTSFVLPGRGDYRTAYLYAVATHPDARGRGLAGRLLAWADDFFRSLAIPAVTTVPAEPSLHNFFGANGFRECFCHREVTLPRIQTQSDLSLEPISPQVYTQLREIFLQDIPHIALSEEAITYQAGCCALSGGGLYAVGTPFGTAILCAEGMGNGTLLVKELLGRPAAQQAAALAMHALLPGFSGLCRSPGRGISFGMLKWLEPETADRWDWSSTAFLGLAFD